MPIKGKTLYDQASATTEKYMKAVWNLRAVIISLLLLNALNSLKKENKSLNLLNLQLKENQGMSMIIVYMLLKWAVYDYIIQFLIKSICKITYWKTKLKIWFSGLLHYIRWIHRHACFVLKKLRARMEPQE